MKIPIYLMSESTEIDGGNEVYYQDELNRVLQQDLSDNGWQSPQQSTENIEAVASQMQNGTFWYDTTTNEVKFKVDGVIKVVAFV